MKRVLLPCLISLLLWGCNGDSSSPTRPQPQGSQPQPGPSQPGPSRPGPQPAEPQAPSSLNLDAREVAKKIKRVADWQLATPIARDPRHWSMAALYAGLIDASLTTGDPQYLAAVLKTGMRIDFKLGSRKHHADGHAAGHSWLRIYLMNPQRNAGMLQPFVKQFSEIVENPILEELSFTKTPPEGLRRTDRWTWSDALYMSPPTIAVLAQATGDDRYLQFMDAEYRFAYDALFDAQENLFYRDGTYIDQRTPNGEKVFWGRGNGWAYAGLALMLSSLPDDHPTRQFYIRLFQRMSPALLAAQQPDGFWYPSLKDPQHAAMGETSASAFFVFGMAWGVRQGLLDPATYLPIVERGWKAILTVIEDTGAVTSVQPFGEVPQLFDPSSSVQYGTGAVLLAGSEILRVLGADAKAEPAKFLSRAESLLEQTPDLSSVCERCN